MLVVGDTVIVKNSACTNNSAALTVATAGSGTVIVNETLTNEAAGAYITICKRAALSNNAVLLADSPSGKMYARYDSSALLLGDASNGKFNWYDATKCYTIHAAAADLQMIATTKTLRIVGGAGEIGRYFAGMLVVCSGFANAVNKLPGYRVVSVTVNGADLDIVLWTGNQTLIAEAAAGSRAIKIVCSSAFSYAAAANAALVGGYGDWAVANLYEIILLGILEAPAAAPNITAFPSGWSATLHSSTTQPNIVADAIYYNHPNIDSGNADKSTVFPVALVRGG